jgi:hypothetical protein
MRRRQFIALVGGIAATLRTTMSESDPKRTLGRAKVAQRPRAVNPP